MTLTNWGGNVTIADRDGWTRVTSLDQLQSMLAREEGTVRVLGSRFTYPAQLKCPDGTHGILLDLPGRGVGELRGENLHVTGDTLLEDVWRAFGSHGLEPATCPPVITSQTVAGALATGTHAQGLTGGTLSDCVAAIELMDGTGVLHRLTPVTPTSTPPSSTLGASAWSSVWNCAADPQPSCSAPVSPSARTACPSATPSGTARPWPPRAGGSPSTRSYTPGSPTTTPGRPQTPRPKVQLTWTASWRARATN